MKKCFKCGIEKPLSEFYKHKQMSDGHLNKCKECAKKDVKKHRDNNLEKVREYDRRRPNAKERVEKHKEYLKTEAGKKAESRGRINYRSKFPEKYKATNAVSSAIRGGRIERPAHCEICGAKCTPHGHHWSYEKENWLDVQWVCVHCHIDIHAEIREKKRLVDEKR